MLEDAISQRTTCDLLRLLGEVPEALIDRAGGIERLARADPFEIAAWMQDRDLDAYERERSVTPAADVMRAAQAVVAAFELGRRAEIARAKPLTRFTSADDVAEWAKSRLVPLTHEELWMIGVDGRGFLRATRCIARGGLHGAAVHPADPLRAALRVDASAFLLVHNHPSGDPTPSKEDILLTEHVAQAAAAAGLALLDHVVVAREGFTTVPLPPPPAPKRRKRC